MLIPALVLCVVSAQIGMSAVNVALPELASWSGGGFEEAQWAVVAYLLAMTAASLGTGYLGDVLGRERTLRIGLLVFVTAGIVCAAAPSLWVLVLGRAVQGAGAAAMAALPLAIARDSVPAERTGTVMGLLGTAAAIGTASGPAIGGLLIGAWGWPAVFWAMLPLPLVALATISGALVRPAGRRGTGSARSPEAKRTPSSGRLGLLDDGRASLGLGAILNLVVGAVMMSTLIVGPFYLSGALGLNPATVGVAMAAGPVISIVSGVLSGRLVDRGSPTALMTAGLCLMTVAATALAVLPPLIGLPGYLAGTMLLAPGYQLFMAANNTRTIGAVSPARRGTASGVLGLARNLGLLIGTSVLGGVFAAAVGAVDAAAVAELDAGLRLVFGIAAASLGIAVVVSCTRKPFGRQGRR